MTTPGDPVSALLIYGPLGIVVILMIVGLLVAKPTLDDVKKRADKAENQRDALTEDFKPVLQVLNKVNDEVLPALISAQGDLRGAGQELARLADEIRRLVEKGQ